MKKIYLLDDAIISPLGFSTEENLIAIKNESSGLKFHKNNRLQSGGFYAGIIENELLTKTFLKILIIYSFCFLLLVHKQIACYIIF